MRTASAAALLLSLLFLLPLPAGAQEGDDGLLFGADNDELGEDAPPEESTDESTPDYLKALELQRKGKFISAQKAFQKLLEKYPDSVHREAALLRSEPNHFAGCEKLHISGPPSRRIDVSVMGDGFTHSTKDQRKERDWAELCLEVLYSEASFEAYKDYFNYYFVRLVSEDEKVDPNITEAQKKKIDEKNKRRAKKKKYDYSTALDCKAAGPQGQVVADRRLVYKWLEVAEQDTPGAGDDRIVIAFARFGKLGMGGGGIANVGRPDKSVTVHEFGHAFVGLLDEYANRPGPPPQRWQPRAANATCDPEDVPWQHFLDAKVRGVGVYEGGATFKKGVWRPARSCAMNSAGNTGFCPVCREASVLAIYRYVNPIDVTSPHPGNEMKIVEGDEKFITVTPMQPRDHDLEVEWFVETIATDIPGPDAAEDDAGGTSDLWPGSRFRGFNRGERIREDREAYETPPAGELSSFGKPMKVKKGETRRHQFHLEKLPPGRYRITVQVKDTTEWVLKDPRKLLEERETWWVTVAPQPPK